MYLCDRREEGLHRLLEEVLSNSLTEAQAGRGQRITVELVANGGCRVSDEGGGIWVDAVPEFEKSFLECILTRHSWCFGQFGDRDYRNFGGHRVGLLTVNALSRRLEIFTCRDGRVWSLACERGKVVTPLHELQDGKSVGTEVAFWYDPEIFSTRPSFDRDRIANRLRELAALHPGVTLELVDLRGETPHAQQFSFPEGLVGLLREALHGRQQVHPSLFTAEVRGRDPEGSVALCWVTSDEQILRTFANGMSLTDGGTAVTGLFGGLTRALRHFLREIGHPQPDAFHVEDFREGLIAFAEIRLSDPQFTGATRERLLNPEAAGFLQRLIRRHLPRFLHEHPEEATAIVARFERARESREAVWRARRRDPNTGELKPRG
jgi:DNA gyrase subunit B